MAAGTCVFREAEVNKIFDYSTAALPVLDYSGPGWFLLVRHLVSGVF